MKKILLLFYSLTSIFLSAQIQNQECGTDEYMKDFYAKNPDLYEQNKKFNDELIKISKNNQLRSVTIDGTVMYEIPVVVHVIHTGNPVGGLYNPSDKQITDWIDFTNKVLAGHQPETNNSPNMRFQLALAKRSPDCQPTNGIVRVDGRVIPGYEDNTPSSDPASLSRWDYTSYYNIYVVKYYNGALGLTIMNFNGSSEKIYIVSSVAVAGRYTLAHEVGHAMGLGHVDDGYNIMLYYDGYYRIRYNDQQQLRAWDILQTRINLLNSLGATPFSEDTVYIHSLTQPSCIPIEAGSAGNFYYGPTKVQFGTINFNSSGKTLSETTTYFDYYAQKKCLNRVHTYIKEGVPTELRVSNTLNSQNIRVYIDYNDDGIFNETDELVANSVTSVLGEYVATITPPLTAVLNKPLRMRVISGRNYDNACPQNLIRGQVEDYGVTIRKNSNSIRITNPYGDIDGDGILNMNDTDNDNDGIPDCVENGVTGDMNELFYMTGNARQRWNDPTTINEAASASGPVTDPVTHDIPKVFPYQVQLTQPKSGQSGAIWSRSKIDFSNSFTLMYQAYLGRYNSGADGMAAVFHNDPAGLDALGSYGSGLGAAGINNGIALELDTYNNPGGMDVSNDHGSIWRTEGGISDFMSTPISLGDIEDNKWHNVVVSWDISTLTLSYTVQLGDGSFVQAGTFTFNSLDDLRDNYFGGSLEVRYGYTSSTGSFWNDQRIKFADLCADFPAVLDMDGDEIPDYLDLDSDGDGCPDSVEGSDNVIPTQVLPNGVIDFAGTGGVNATGIPVIVNTGNIADTDTADGQGIGVSKIAYTTKGCYCSKTGADGVGLETKVGITSLGRAEGNSNWPMVRKGGWLALESKTKGFVLNRIATSAAVEALPNPQQGMLVYDVEADCMKMYIYIDKNDPTKGGIWKCIKYQACPDDFMN